MIKNLQSMDSRIDNIETRHNDLNNELNIFGDLKNKIEKLKKNIENYKSQLTEKLNELRQMKKNREITNKDKIEKINSILSDLNLDKYTEDINQIQVELNTAEQEKEKLEQEQKEEREQKEEQEKQEQGYKKQIIEELIKLINTINKYKIDPSNYDFKSFEDNENDEFIEKCLQLLDIIIEDAKKETSINEMANKIFEKNYSEYSKLKEELEINIINGEKFVDTILDIINHVKNMVKELYLNLIKKKESYLNSINKKDKFIRDIANTYANLVKDYPAIAKTIYDGEKDPELLKSFQEMYEEYQNFRNSLKSNNRPPTITKRTAINKLSIEELEYLLNKLKINSKTNLFNIISVAVSKAAAEQKEEEKDLFNIIGIAVAKAAAKQEEEKKEETESQETNLEKQYQEKQYQEKQYQEKELFNIIGIAVAKAAKESQSSSSLSSDKKDSRSKLSATTNEAINNGNQPASASSNDLFKIVSVAISEIERTKKQSLGKEQPTKPRENGLETMEEAASEGVGPAAQRVGTTVKTEAASEGVGPAASEGVGPAASAGQGLGAAALERAVGLGAELGAAVGLGKAVGLGAAGAFGFGKAAGTVVGLTAAGAAGFGFGILGGIGAVGVVGVEEGYRRIKNLISSSEKGKSSSGLSTQASKDVANAADKISQSPENISEEEKLKLIIQLQKELNKEITKSSLDYYIDLKYKFIEQINYVIRRMETESNGQDSFRAHVEFINKFNKINIPIFEKVKLDMLYRICNVIIPAPEGEQVNLTRSGIDQINHDITKIVDLIQSKINETHLLLIINSIINLLNHDNKNINTIHKEFSTLVDQYRNKESEKGIDEDETLKKIKLMYIIYYLQNATIDTLFEFKKK